MLEKFKAPSDTMKIALEDVNKLIKKIEERTENVNSYEEKVIAKVGVFFG